MSTEWTVVTRNKRNVKVANQPVAVVAQKAELRPTREEQIRKENDKRQQWEQRRQKKIDEYNIEFPLLPGSKDLVSDAQKIAYIDAKIDAKKESEHKAYLKREARRQEKAKREAEIAEIEEKKHIQDMIEKWGAHRWYEMVEFTEDDCDTAVKLRNEEDERELLVEQLEKVKKEEQERLEKIREAEEEKYIAEQTANMTQPEKDYLIQDYKFNKMIELEDQMFSYWERAYYYGQKQEKEDKERLDRWNVKQKNKK